MSSFQSNEGMTTFMDQLDFLVLQHVNYLNNLDNACKKKIAFAHKKPTDCNFGKLFYGKIWPDKETMPEILRLKVEEIEMEHRTFHETAALVDSENPTGEVVDAVGACRLILKLYALERELKISNAT